jgi:hypothetical protein
MDKKTNFPDLERLPSHNHFKHFLDWLINKPRIVIENYVRGFEIKFRIKGI